MAVIIKRKLIKPTAQEFLTKVIEPVLCYLPEVPYSQAAAQLLLGTAIKESGGFRYRKQIGGPALGFFQIEPETHDDIWNNYLKYRPTLRTAITRLMTNPSANKFAELEYNDSYAAALARVSYKRITEKIPTFGDIDAMGRYWKRHYNTPLGKGTVKAYVEIWNKAIAKNEIKFKKACGL